jgi:hypothetical protein
MTWARLDDRTQQAPEWVAVTNASLRAVGSDRHDLRPDELAEIARIAAQRAKFVHLVSLMWAVPALSDGRLSPAAVEQICAIGSLTPTEWYTSAELLVSAGAWKRIKPTNSEPLGAYQMLLGWSPGEQPTRAEDEQRRRMTTLRGRLRPGRADYPHRVAAVERSAGRCEYCDAKLGAEGGEIDHVDPRLFTNDVDNLAHVCGGCNKTKGYHQLDEVGMSFTARALAARAVTRASHVPPARPTPARRQSRAGSGRDGSGRVGKGGVGSGAAKPPTGTNRQENDQ